VVRVKKLPTPNKRAVEPLIIIIDENVNNFGTTLLRLLNFTLPK
jgi:hypothetical protein